MARHTDDPHSGDSRRRDVPHRQSEHAVNAEVRQPTTLLPFVMQMLHGISRNKAKSLLTHGSVSVDGRVTTNHATPLQPGQTVIIGRTGKRTTPPAKHFSIVYEDRWLVVVDKMPGVLSMGVGAKSLNLKTLLDSYFAASGQRCTAHVVHRLDCRTSGLMVYAKSVDVQQAMVADWQGTVVDRRYVAVVRGTMEQEQGRVESWLTDTPSMVVLSSPTDNGGKHAITTWRLLRQGRDTALLELKLLTGRKNQIRVHMRDIGHPVVGDGKYGGGEADGRRDVRLCLHALRLAFRHPVTGEVLDFDTVVPPHFVAQLKNS